MIDERWMADWINMGIRELERYLGKHARFEVYCQNHDTEVRQNECSSDTRNASQARRPTIH